SLARLVVEAAIVFWALDDIAHHQPVGEAVALVRAKPIGGEELVLGAPIDGEGSRRVVEADDVFVVDIVGGAGSDPGHWGFLTRQGWGGRPAVAGAHTSLG